MFSLWNLKDAAGLLWLALSASQLRTSSAFSLRPLTTTSTRTNFQHISSSYATFDLRLPSSVTAGDDICTVQILMSDTGGGHRASANAIRDAFDVLYPGRFQCDIVDIYTDYGPFWPFNDVVAGYKIMAKYSFLWDIFYHFGETDIGLWLNELCLSAFCFNSFRDCLNRPSGDSGKRADMVVSVHPLCQYLPLQVLADLDSKGESREPHARTTPFVTVVTDLGGAHKTWFDKDVDKCFVPTDVLKEKAISRGLSENQIVEYGLPIRKGFWRTDSSSTTQKEAGENHFWDIFKGGKKEEQASVSKDPNKASLRAQLGLDEDLPTVLIVGGGDGMGGIVDIASAIGQKLGSSSAKPAYQMVVVCGSNKDAQSKLSIKEWGPGVRASIQGFVNNMDEWMNASDALVTKAGPGTIAEASICGLPCMLFAYLPGQEAGNVPYVEESGFGKYSGDPTVIADTVSSWLASPEKMESMKNAALAAARPQATLDIAKDLAEIAFATKKGSKVLVRPR